MSSPNAPTLITNIETYSRQGVSKIAIVVKNQNVRNWIYSENVLDRLRFATRAQLVPHEETILTNVQKIIAEFKEIGFFTTALPVARIQTPRGWKYLILDGHHRTLLMFDEFQTKVIPVFVFDYPGVGLGTYYPTIDIRPQEMAKWVQMAKMCGFEEGMGSLQTGQAYSLAVRMEGGQRVCCAFGFDESASSHSVRDMVDHQKWLISKINQYDHVKIKYLRDRAWLETPNSGHTVLIRNSYTRDQVVAYAIECYMRGEGAYPPKSTAHEFPAAIHVAIPGEWLYYEESMANTLLNGMKKSGYVMTNYDS